MLILPGNPLFDITLAVSRPPGWKETAKAGDDWFCMVADSATGIMRPATYKEMIDYVKGGEYEERLELIGEDADN